MGTAAVQERADVRKATADSLSFFLSPVALPAKMGSLPGWPRHTRSGDEARNHAKSIRVG